MHTQPNIHIPLPTNIKLYTALISQTGTAAPTAIITKNDIGNIIWTRHDTGDYRGTLQGAFPENKTIFMQGQSAGVNVQFYPDRLDDNTIQLLVYNNGSANDEWSRLNLEIRTYHEPQHL